MFKYGWKGGLNCNQKDNNNSEGIKRLLLVAIMTSNLNCSKIKIFELRIDSKQKYFWRKKRKNKKTYILPSLSPKAIR
jgi:hypothetical protein